MATGRGSDRGERKLLQESLNSHLGYGTAAVSSTVVKPKTDSKPRSCISHRLFRTDTLMGLSLKYGITVQDLKKENKLWNTDHLFLRETLLIPLTPENEHLLDEHDTIVVCDGSTTSASPSGQELANGDLPGSSVTKLPAGQSGESTAPSTDTSQPQSTCRDFFAKYDTSIARLKGDVAKMEKNAANLEGIIDSNPLALPPRKGSGVSRRDSNSSTASTSSDRRIRIAMSEENSSPVLLIRSRTNSRQVKSTIENLKQVNDDLFEL